MGVRMSPRDHLGNAPGECAGLRSRRTIPSLSRRSERKHPVAANENEKIFIAPGEGAHLPVLDIVHKITAARSGGSLTVEEWGLPPGMMIPPHTHAREDECAFVLEGELAFDVGGKIVLARPARSS